MKKNQWKGYWRGNEPNGDTHQRAREVVRPTGTFMRGKFPSRKNGRMVHFEGLLERDAIILFEGSPHVVRYREQPSKFHYPDGAKLRRYTPDFELILDTGEIQYVEVKHTNSLSRQEVRHQINCIERHFNTSGVDFMVLTEKVIRQEPRLSNLRKICTGAKRIWPTDEAIQNALDPIRQKFPASLGEIDELLAKYDLDAFSLFLTGVLDLDLNRDLSPETSVDIVKEKDDAHFWIA